MTGETRLHVVVTGAASGIGAGIASDLAEHGWRVTGVDIQAEVLRRVLDDLSARYGTETTALAGDLADPEFARGIVNEAWTQAPIDGLVNAAGIYPAVPFLDLTAEAWDRVQNVNVRAGVLATIELARRAIPLGLTPAVVNLASGAAVRARPGTAHYSTSKAAVVMATKACAVELGASGIRVNAVAPGFFAVDSVVNPVTPEYLTHMNRSLLPGPATVDKVAGAVRFLLGPDASWITGVTIPVDGGGSAGTNTLPQHWPEPTSLQLGLTETVP